MVVQTGGKIDHYVLEELIAGSDTASIYRARDLRSDRRLVLKIPRPEVEGDLLFYQRFCRERDILETLNHPGVAKGFPQAGRSRVYIAMELAPGRLLRHLLQEERQFPQDRAVRLAFAIAEALEYIHAQGVVHRDLKPENIIVGTADRIKLIDFGIASQTRARRLTFGKFSQAMGTPDYISPEQLKGKRGDGRTDIYALGVILYEMLTGKAPFAGKNLFAVMHARLVSDPVPPREINPAISLQLQAVVRRAMERHPKNRYACAKDFSNDLLHLDQVRISERSESRWPPSIPRLALWYGMVVMIPVLIFGLLLYVARNP
jgi:eukaryotic-like serine/threonine-protein kinase